MQTTNHFCPTCEKEFACLKTIAPLPFETECEDCREGDYDLMAEDTELAVYGDS